MARANLFFKVICVLMIITAVISVILGIIGVISCIMSADDPEYASALPFYIAAASIAAVSGILQLIAGIVGIKNIDRPEKAAVCIVLGIIVLAANIADQFFSNSLSGDSAMITASSIFISLALPVLYIIGVVFKKKNI